MTRLRVLRQELQALLENPIDNLSLIGDWSRNSSFKDVDRRLLTSPKAIEKVRAAWNATPFHFDLYFVNDPRVNKSDYQEVGEVDMRYVRHELELDMIEFPGNRADAITVIYTNNVAAQRVMMTGWTMAHRVGHAFRSIRGGGGQTARMFGYYQETLNRIAEELWQRVYDFDAGPKSWTDWRVPSRSSRGDALKLLAQTIGTMKSARDANIRNMEEFSQELFAQYLLTGHITFNRLPKLLPVRSKPWGRKDYVVARDLDQDENELGYYNGEYSEPSEDDEDLGVLDAEARDLEYSLEQVLHAAVGHIFVM